MELGIWAPIPHAIVPEPGLEAAVICFTAAVARSITDMRVRAGDHRGGRARWG